MAIHHPSREKIESFISGELKPKEIVAIGDHLAICAECQAIASTAMRPSSVAAIDNLIAKIKRDAHLSYEELEGYVDDTLPADLRSDVDEHLKKCLDCKNEVDEISALRDKLANRPAAVPQQQASVGSPTPNGNRQEVPGSGFRFALSNREPGRPEAPQKVFRTSPALRFGLALAAAVLCACVLLRFNERLKQVATAYPPAPIAQPTYISPNAPKPGSPLIIKSPIPADAVAFNDAGSSVSIDPSGSVRVDGAKMKLLTPGWPIGGPADGGTLGLSPTQPDEPPGPSLIFPVRTVVEAVTPTFRWKPLASATSYVVTVSSGDGASTVAVSPSLKSTYWRCAVQLTRGRTYSWTVRAAIHPTGTAVSPLPSERLDQFRVVSEAGAARLTEIRKLYPNNKLALGLVQVRLKDYVEAAGNISAYAKQNPGNAAVSRLAKELSNVVDTDQQ